MHGIKNAMLIYTVRCLLEFFNLYGQKDIMGEATWNFTIVMTVVISIINIMLINNLFDKGFLLIELIASFLLITFLTFALYDRDELSKRYSTIIIVGCL